MLQVSAAGRFSRSGDARQGVVPKTKVQRNRASTDAV
jgi:hypothetical protein